MLFKISRTRLARDSHLSMKSAVSAFSLYQPYINKIWSRDFILMNMLPKGFMSQSTTAQEIRTAVTAAWLIVSAILLLIQLSFHIAPDNALTSLSAACQIQHHNQEPCPLCGMTRAFMAISNGRLDQATAFNNWSIALYGIFLANGLLAAIFLASRIRNLFLPFKASNAVASKTSIRKEVDSCRYSV